MPLARLRQIAKTYFSNGPDFEVQFRTTSPKKLRQIFLTHGCVIVREALDPARVRALRAPFEEVFANDKFQFFDADYARHGSLFDILSDKKFDQFLRLVFADHEIIQTFGQGRRVAGLESSTAWQQPLQIHIDAQVHHFEFTVNFWIPLDDCGIRAPSMQLLPRNYLQTRAFVGFTPEVQRAGEEMLLGHFLPDRFQDETIKAAFGQNCWCRPVMKVGDLIISSNWILHGSYRTPEMKEGRMSLELRYRGDKIDIR
jgi:hypothetical protein